MCKINIQADIQTGIQINNRMEQQKPAEECQSYCITRTGEKFSQKTTLLTEHHLELWINEKPAGRMVCTPSDLELLVLGRLFSEGIITELSQVEQLYLCESGNRAKVYLREMDGLKEAPWELPTCCTDNRMYLERASRELPVLQQVKISASQVYGLVEQFQKDTALHRSTGGAHSCVLAWKGEILYAAEDIGRHNALDKAIGYAALHHISPGECMLFTTGRIPVDMARKVIQARIPVLVSKSVPTGEAVSLCRKHGLTLICRAWPDSFEIYSGKGSFC